METIIRAFLIRRIDDIEEFQARIDRNNYIKARKNQEQQYKRIVDYLKKLKQQDKIKSIFVPRNRKLQSKLNNLIRIKKEIKKSICKIKEIYYKR